jgi:hypothetical protein
VEEVFRFLLARPAQRVDAETTTVAVVPSEGYHAQLRTAAASAQPKIAVRRVATAQRQSPDTIRSLDDLPLAKRLGAMDEALASHDQMSLADLEQLVKRFSDIDAAHVVADREFALEQGRLSDGLITSVVLGRDGSVPSDDIAHLLRLLSLVERVSLRDTTLEQPGGMTDALDRVLLLPSDVFPLVDRSVDGVRRSTEPPASRDQADELIAQRDRLLATYEALTRVSPEHLAIPQAPTAVGATEMSAKAALPPVPHVAETMDREAVGSLTRAAAGLGREAFGGQPTPLTSIAPATGMVGLTLRLRPEVAAAFDPVHQAVLAERGLDLTSVPLTVATDRLSTELQGVEMRLTERHAASATTMTKIGGSYVSASSTVIGALAPGSLAAASIPTSHGAVTPVGIGDLLVVRQSLKRYEALELAHIENVLKGEYKERVHKRARTTETTVTTEVEITKEEERDQQTTERFELKNESSQIVKQDESLKIGLSVSGKYGPVVEFKASADFALNHSKEEASKVATSYSKDVTNRATSRISERRREEQILRTIEVFEETNTHGMDNKAGTGPVVGQYQWIDKIYEAQVFNYGKRLLFDIMLPEPAAFLLYATASAPKAGADLVKPVPFTLSPSDINEWNYFYHVKVYAVIGVTPPPPPYVTVGKELDGKTDKDSGGSTTKTLDLPIPDGFQAIAGNVLHAFTFWEAAAATDVLVAKWGHRFDTGGSWSWSFGMANEVGVVGVALKTFRVDVFAATFEIYCQRTQRALDEWKLKTHSAISQAYQKQVRDYEERLAALEVQAAQQFQGTNPAENERLIRSELKKHSISAFTAQHYDLFGAVALSSQGYPQPDLPEAAVEGRYIRFFEQAFEWEQMMFFFYPYYWGRKENWLKRVLIEDVDFLFAEFLKAGSARVVVSVRPGFEQAVAHFLETGVTWDGADLPSIASPLYVSIIEEIRERDKAKGNEIAQGDPWDVHLPTTLIVLRDKPGLPEWQKNAQGEWLPV